MYRNHFSKKSSNFKTVRPKAAVPGGSIKPTATSVTKVDKVIRGPKTHSNSINPTMIKSVNYKIEDDKPVIIVDFYDNIEGFPLDYVKKSETADTTAAIGFDNTLLLPIYYPSGNINDLSAKPHIDELQNMFEWLLMSKDLKTTDPAVDPSTYTQDQVTYCLKLHADTRTIIKEPVNNKINVDLSVVPKAMKADEADEAGNFEYKGVTYPVKKYLNGENYATINYPVVWLGLYGEVNADGVASKPKFLRCYIENFRAEELYIGAGKVDEGVYETVGTVENVTSKIIAGDPFSYYPTHATFVSVQKDGNFIEDGDYEEVYGGCIPGYEVYSETIQQDKPDAGGMEIISRPLQYKEIGTNVITSYENISNLDAGKEIEIVLTKNLEPLDIATREYANEDFKVVKPIISFVYAYTDEEVDWVNPEDKTEGGVLKKLVSQTICSKIKTLKGFHIKGPIKVYQMVNGEATDNSCQLRYLNNITLEDCLLEDEIKPLCQAAIEYFWLYNVQLINCDNQMKYYKLVNEQGIEIIGDQMVGENGEGVRKIFRKGQSYGTSGYNPSNGNMWFDSLDDLYGWLTQKHRVSCTETVDNVKNYYTISAPEVILKEATAAKGFYTLTLYAKNISTLYYHPGTPSKLDWESTNGKEVKLVYELTKDISATASQTSGKYDTVQFHLCWKVDQEEGSDYTTGTGSTKEYWCDTYYGLIGSDYFGELSDIFWKINKVESILEPKTGATKVTSVITADAEKSKALKPSDMSEYLTKLKDILERMPINTKYICEAAGLLAKYVTFENVRMPSIYLQTPGDNPVYEGLDRNHPSSCSEADQTAVNQGVFDVLGKDSDDNNIYVIDGMAEINNNFITYKFKVEDEAKGIDDGDYFWASEPTHDEYPHTSLVNDIASAYEVLNWTCWGTKSNPSDDPENGSKAESVEQELYVATKLILDCRLRYYGQAAPVIGKELTVSMIDLAELEIYEEEAIYQVHYANVKNDIVVGLTLGTDNEGDTTENFIKCFLTEINADLVQYLTLDGANSKQTYAINEFVAYLKPSLADQSKGITASDRNKLIEYSQMLNTIQGQRDFIQKKGEEKKNFLLKFQQTSKGTFFEVMKAEGDNYASEEDVYGYYISQGYGYSLPSSTDNVIKVPKGRKEMRMRGGRGAAPVDSQNKVIGRFRITRMPRYYEQEPVDWRNDNYFSNQIYTLNADNLNTIIDPEFEAREKTIFTKHSTDSTKVMEQEMIGFYTITVSETKINP